MAYDNKQDNSNVTNGGLLIAAIVATGAYFFHHEAPLVGSRPSITEINIQEPGAGQRKSVDARLWEDPFEALGKALDKTDRQELKTQCEVSATHRPALQEHPECFSPFIRDDSLADQNVAVLGVVVPGAPYAEDSERRRRTRYAVLAGLERRDFAPEDYRHLSYFVWSRGKDLNFFIPYERFRSQTSNKIVIILWIKEGTLDNEPLKGLIALKKFLFSDKSAYKLINGHKVGKATRTPQAEREHQFAILGPDSSDKLRQMIRELDPCQDGSSRCPIDLQETKNERKIRLYSYSANASDEALLTKHAQIAFDGKSMDCSEKPNNYGAKDSVASIFSNVKFVLERTTSVDSHLSKSIVNEIHNRLILDGRAEWLKARDTYNVALISEWDTFYGQTLPKDVISELCRTFTYSQSTPDASEIKVPNVHVTTLTYLRGLDGQLPSREGNDAENTEKVSSVSATKGEKDNNAASFLQDADRRR